MILKRGRARESEKSEQKARRYHVGLLVYPVTAKFLVLETEIMLRIRIASSTRDQVNRIIEHLSSQAVGFEVLRAPSEGVGKGDYSGALSLGSGGAVLDVSELPNLVSTARRFANKRPISRLVSVDIADPSIAPGIEPAVPLPYKLTDMAKWILEDRPVVTPALSVSSHRSHPHGTDMDASASLSNVSAKGCDDGMGIRGLHEVVLSYGDDTASSSRMHEAMSTVGMHIPHIPNVWRVPCRSDGESVAFRLLPSSLSAIIVGVENLGLAKESLSKRGIPHENIGMTGASHGQLMLSSPILTGLDVRLCQYDTEPLIFFNEGTEVMMDGALDELNPAIVRAARQEEHQPQDGRGRVEYRNMETDGHCWTEFHANIRNPSGFIKKRPAVRKG